MVLDEIVEAFADVVDAYEQTAEDIGAERAEQSAAALEKLLRTGKATIPGPEGEQEVTLDIPEAFEETQQTAFSFVGELPEESQELILERIRPDDIEEDGNVREAIQSAEGGAVAQASGVLASTLALETGSAGQLESHQFLVSQLLTFLALENVLGLEIETTVREGVVPVLEREVNREYREQDANLNDVVEQQLRNKDSDTDYLDDLGRYGIRPEDVPTLEEVAISALEPEELLETPVQYGVLPDTDTIDAELDRAGISEAAKELFLDVLDEAPRTSQFYEERTVLEEAVPQLDEQVLSGELTPAEAAESLPEEADRLREPLEERWGQLSGNARERPSEADTLSAFSSGLIGLSTAGEELATPGREDVEVSRLLAEEALDELDGDLRQALGLGLIDEAAYTEIAAVAGLDQSVVNRLLEGDDLDDIADDRLASSDTSTGQGVETIIGIGPARSAALEGVGIGTVSALAQAEPERVASVAQVSVETAQGFVDAARSRIQA